MRLVGCISLEISQECQLELAAVGATLALRLITLLVYPYAGCYTYLERRVTKG